MNVHRYPILPRDNPDSLAYFLPQWLMHDLLQPLNALGLLLDDLGAQLMQLCPQEENLHQTLRQVRRAMGSEQSLMASLRQYLRSSLPLSEVEKPQSVPLAALVEDIHELHREGVPGISIQVNGLPGLCIESVRYLLKDILSYLIENALAYARSSVVISAKPRVDGVLLQIEDDGPGVPEDIVSLLGMPFIKSRRGKRAVSHGLGLGIFLASKYAARLGHPLLYSKPPEGGACFAILLPYSAGFSPVNRKRKKLILEGIRVALCGLPASLDAEIAETLRFFGAEGIDSVVNPTGLASIQGTIDLVVTTAEKWASEGEAILEAAKGRPGFLILSGAPGTPVIEPPNADMAGRIHSVDLPVSLPRLLVSLLQCLAQC